MSFCNKLTKKNMTINNSDNDNNNNNKNNNANANFNVSAKKCL